MTLTPYINLITTLVVVLTLWKGLWAGLLSLVALRLLVSGIDELANFVAWHTEISIPVDRRFFLTMSDAEKESAQCPQCHQEMGDNHAFLYHSQSVAKKICSAGFFFCNQCDDFWPGVEIFDGSLTTTTPKKYSYIMSREMAKTVTYNWFQLCDAEKSKHRVIGECTGCQRPEATHERRVAVKRARYWGPLYLGTTHYMGLDTCLLCDQRRLCSWSQLA